MTEDLDLSDLSEALFAGKSRSSITQLACYDMSDACKVKPPPVPKVKGLVLCFFNAFGNIAGQPSMHAKLQNALLRQQDPFVSTVALECFSAVTE